MKRRSPLSLLALLARRGERDLHALVDWLLGRGRPEGETLDGLVRSGLVRGRKRPKISPRLIVPLMALDRSLSLTDVEVTGELTGMLDRSHEEAQRSVLLSALCEQLDEHLTALSEGAITSADREALHKVLADLQRVLERLKELDGDSLPEVTRAAALCARVVESVARTLTPRRKPRAKALPAGDSRELAWAVGDLSCCLTRVLALPAPEVVAAALAPRRLPTFSAAPARLEDSSHTRVRRQQVALALSYADPLQALYGGTDVVEALRRHAEVVALGSELRQQGWRSSSVQRSGPDPLEWSTDLEAITGREVQRAA